MSSPSFGLAPLFFGVLLLCASLAVLPLAWRLSDFIAGTSGAGRRSASKPVAWGFVDIGIVLSWIVFFSLAMHFVLPTSGKELDLPALLSFSALLLGTTGVVIAAIARFRDPEGLRALGLRSGGIVRGALGGWFAYAAMVPGGIGLAFCWSYVLERLGVHSEVQVVVAKFLELGERDVPLVLVLGIAVLPFLEELVFRGFLQPVLVKHAGRAWGVVFTSVLFGALHGASAFLPIFGLSLVLGTVMLRTQRLVASWAVHALHNGLVFGLLLFFRAHPELMPKMALLATP